MLVGKIQPLRYSGRMIRIQDIEPSCIRKSELNIKQTKMKKIETFLPVFPGFYGTIFEADEENEISGINDEREGKGLERLDLNSDIKFDYATYEQDVCEGAVDFIEGELMKLGLVKWIKFQTQCSPKEYNFANDSINIKVGTNVRNLSKYINSHVKEFRAYLKEHYTSYDGFISFQSNDADEWRDETKNFMSNLDGHKLGALLEFVCEVENIDSESMYYCTEAYLSVEDYEHETTKIKCPDCGEWYSQKDLIECYQHIVEKDKMSSIGLFLIEPKIRLFEEWVLNAEHKHCT